MAFQCQELNVQGSIRKKKDDVLGESRAGIGLEYGDIFDGKCA